MSTGPIFLWQLITQTHVEPVSTQPETVTEDRWHQPWSEPVRQKIAPALAIALIASGSIWPPTPVQAAVSTGWFEPLSDPVRVKPQLPTPEQQFFAGDTLTIPTSRIGWYEPLSEPVRLKIGLPDHLQQYSTLDTITIPTSNGMGWFGALSDPVRTAPRLGTGANQDLAFTPTQTQAATVLEASADIAGPTFSRVTQYQSVAWPPTPVQAAVTIGWFGPLSDPVRVQRFTTGAQQFLAYTGSAPFPERVTEDRWHQPWSEPVRFRVGLAPHLQQSLALPLSAFQPSDNIAWLTPFATPQSKRPVLSPDWQFPPQQTTATTVFGPWAVWPDLVPTKAKAVVDFKPWTFIEPAPQVWYPPDRWPDMAPAAKRAAQYQDFSFCPQTAQEATLVSKWYSPLSEPVRVKPTPTPNPFSAYTEAAPFPESVTEDRWHQPWSEPVRLRQFPTSEQSSFVSGSITALSIIPWFEALSEPVRLKTGLLAAQQAAFTSDTASIPTSNLMPWFGAFTDPVLIKPRLITGANQDLAFPAQFSVEVTLVSKWFEPLSEPVRVKPGISAGSQQVLISIPFNELTLVSKWFESLSEPVRTKPSILTSSQQAFFATAPYAPVELTLVSKWFESLSEPKRFKAGLAAHLQSSYTNDTIAETIKKIGRLIPWFEALSEPVRAKLRLLTGANQSTALNPFPLPSTAIGARLDVTEQGDSFSGQIVVSGGIPPGGNVGIIENTAGPSIVVSITEPITVPATGVPVVIPAGARVTIIDLGPGIWL